jgi:hypothetical protein
MPSKPIENVSSLPLVRDMLDKQLIDAEETQSGRVDGLILQLRASRAPRVKFIEVGTSTLASRLHPRLGRLVQRFERRVGPRIDKPWRVGVERVKKIGMDITIDVHAERTKAFAWENWLRQHVLRHLPGSGL